MNIFKFSERLYSSDERLPRGDSNWGERLRFIDTIKARPSLMYRSARESIDAGISLLANGQVSQAFLSLFQAAEVSLKGLLDEIQQIGTRTWAAQNPVLFRRRAANGLPFEEFRIKEVVTEKTFIAAFREASAFVNFSSEVESGITLINNTRRLLIHQGGVEKQEPTYLHQILHILIPLLDEFYTNLAELPICNLIFGNVARELVVAARFLRLRKNDPTCWRYALRPMIAAYFSRFEIAQGAPFDFDPSGRGQDSRWRLNCDWADQVKRELKGDLITQEELATPCYICGEQCCVSTNGEIKKNGEIPYFEIHELVCPYCHLTIPSEYSDLAGIHYGPISEERMGSESWRERLRGYGLDPVTFEES
jgi:hypothetical protein